MINEKEDFKTYSYDIILNNGEKISNDHLLPPLNGLFNGDKLSVIISVDETDPARHPLNNTDDLDKVMSLNEEIDAESTTVINFETIKSDTDGLKIYNSKAFYKFLNTLTLHQLFTNFSLRYSHCNSVKMVFKNSEYILKTNLFNSSIVDNEEKSAKLESWNFAANSQNIGQYGFIPEDFMITDYSEDFSEYKVLFDKLSFILSVSFIADVSAIKDDIFEYKIIGYKKIDQSLKFHELRLTSDNYFYKVYSWIYSQEQSNIEDKLGLARNIISRHIVLNTNVSIIDIECFSAIISAYKIYLKDNVEKYIETKNKVAEISTELTVKSKEISTYVISSFKNNNLTLSTFFISLFVFNSLSDNSEAKIFTLEKYYLTIVILLISLVYLIITRIQVNAELKAQEEYYNSIKNIYTDVFDQKELNTLFSEKHLYSTFKFVNSSTNRFSWFWIIEVMALGATAVYLTFFI